MTIGEMAISIRTTIDFSMVLKICIGNASPGTGFNHSFNNFICLRRYSFNPSSSGSFSIAVFLLSSFCPSSLYSNFNLKIKKITPLRTIKKCYLFLLSFLIWGELTAQRKPNIILIVADDLGYGDIEPYGQQKIKTPHLNQLAADGKRFTRFYAASTVCAPSRASLMSGKHTGHTAVRGNIEIQPEGQFPIPDSTFTLAELFKKAGYVTGAFGKWGLGYPGSDGDPVNQGFDVFFGYNCQRQSHNYYPAHLWQNTRKVYLNNTHTHQQQYAPDIIQQQTMAFLDDYKQQPFFLYLPYTLPHAGLQVGKSDTMFDHYKAIFQEKPVQVVDRWKGEGYQPQAYPRAAYATMVTALDRYIGEVMNKLDELGLTSNTMILFTSDNGPHQEGGNDPDFFASNAGFRGIKRDLYEGGIRVPLMVSWPGKVHSGTVSHHLAAGYDILATFADVLGLPVTDQDGISFLPEILSSGQQQQHPFLYWEFIERGGSQAVRLGNWKAIRLNTRQNRFGPIQLYDLSRDPVENDDLSHKYPSIVRQISKIMEEQHIEPETQGLWK